MEIIAGFGCIFRTSKNKENSYLAFGNFHLKVNIDGVSLTLQGFVSNSTPLYCNVENLVGIDGCIATILKNRSDTCFKYNGFEGVAKLCCIWLTILQWSKMVAVELIVVAIVW
jgi:hypothetical protein